MHASASERIATIDSNDAVILEWQYTPANFFEEPVVVPGPDYEIRIEHGKATATVAPEAYDEEHRKRDALHGVVDGYFRGVQFFNHRTFTFSGPAISRVYPDGRRDATVGLVTLHETIAMTDRVDVRVTRADGSVVRDSKRERIDAEVALGEAIGRLRPQDPLLGKLLDSFQAAVEDPADELVHLYEIRDALSEHFGGERAAQDALGVSSTDWKQLGLLANATPVEQGRHRGKHHELLRQATTGELEGARKIARELLEAYVRWAEAALAARS